MTFTPPAKTKGAAAKKNDIAVPCHPDDARGWKLPGEPRCPRCWQSRRLDAAIQAILRGGDVKLCLAFVRNRICERCPELRQGGRDLRQKNGALIEIDEIVATSGVEAKPYFPAFLSHRKSRTATARERIAS
jgi:hypothetical protein